MDNFKDEIATIKRIKNVVDAEVSNIVILLVINSKSDETVHNDYEDFSVTTEYFSEAELKEITNGFEKAGCKVDYSNGEKEFNERLIRGDFKKYEKLNKIVYNSTGSGTGRCRTAFMPALCNLYQLNNCSNDIYTSTIPENKVHFFNLLSFYNFPIPRTWFYDGKSGWLTGEPNKNLRLIAKPAYECASIGISEKSVAEFTGSFFNHIKDLSDSMRQPILVQEFIDGYEVEVPVFDIGEAFTPMSVGINMSGEEFAGSHFLTYDKVYDDLYQFYSFCRYNREVGDNLKKIARDSFNKLNLSGMMRVDFRVDKNGNGFIMDYNNSPHLTEFHSCAFSIKDLGFNYSDMLRLLLYRFVDNKLSLQKKENKSILTMK